MDIPLQAPEKALSTAPASIPQKKDASFSQRLYSLDALRGFDMFWIMGAEEIFHALFKVTGSPFFGAISTELTHPNWNVFIFMISFFRCFFLSQAWPHRILLAGNWKKGKQNNKCYGVL